MTTSIVTDEFFLFWKVVPFKKVQQVFAGYAGRQAMPPNEGFSFATYSNIEFQVIKSNVVLL
jgi:hypothetical protein